MDLKCPIMAQDDLLDAVSQLCGLLVSCVEGVDSKAGEDDSGLLVDLHLESSCKLVDMLDVHGVRKLDVHRHIVPVRTVVVKEKIISSIDFRLGAGDVLYLLCKLCIGAVTEDVIDGLQHHFDTRFYDEA